MPAYRCHLQLSRYLENDNAIHAEESRHLFRLVYTFHVIERGHRPALPLFQLLIASEPHLRAEYLSSLKTLDEDKHA